MSILQYSLLCVLRRRNFQILFVLAYSCKEVVTKLGDGTVGCGICYRKRKRTGFPKTIAPCILLIVVNVRTGTPSNPSEALENIGIVVGPILADADDAVVVEGRR
jgi:hypothetical protein